MSLLNCTYSVSCCTFPTTPELTFTTDTIFILTRAKCRSEISLGIRQPFKNCPKRDNLSETLNSNVLSRVLMRDTLTYIHQVENSIPVAKLVFTRSIMVILWYSVTIISVQKQRHTFKEGDKERTSI